MFLCYQSATLPMFFQAVKAGREPLLVRQLPIASVQGKLEQMEAFHLLFNWEGGFLLGASVGGSSS